MARGDFPSAKQDQFVLRFPEGLRDRVKAAAEINGRSMNSEIVAKLEEAYPASDELSFIDEIDELKAKLDRIRAARVAEEAQRAFDKLNTLIERADDLLKKPEKE